MRTWKYLWHFVLCVFLENEVMTNRPESTTTSSITSHMTIINTESSVVSSIDPNTENLTTPSGKTTTDSNAIHISNAVLTTNTSWTSPGTYDNAITTAPSTMTIPNTTETPSVVSSTEETSSTIATSPDTESSDSSSTASSKITMNSPLGTIATDSTAVLVSNTVLATEAFGPLSPTDGNIVATAPSTVTITESTKTTSAVSNTQKALSKTDPSTDISATISSDTSSIHTSRVTPTTSIGTINMDSTIVAESNTVLTTESSGPFPSTNTNLVTATTSTITISDTTVIPSAVSYTHETLLTTVPSKENSATESSHTLSTDTSGVTLTTPIGAIAVDSTRVQVSTTVPATDTSETFTSTESSIAATALSTVNIPDITKTPAAVSDTEKSLSPTASSSAISATTSSDTSSADTSRVNPITSIGTMPVDSTTVPMSNTVQATDSSGSILATDSNVVPSATSTITLRDSTTTPSAVSFTLESVSTTPPSGEISTTESSHISSPDTSRANPTTFIGTIDSTTVPESQSVLATDTSEPFPSTDAETVAMSLSTVNIPDITKTPAAVSDTEKSLSPTASSSAISATTSSDTSSADTSRVTPITSIGTMPVDSTTVPMSNTVQATDTSGSILATDSNVVPSATSTITARDSTTTPSAVSFTLESVSTTPPSGEISTTESSHISSPDTSRATPTTFIGTIDSTSVPESQPVLATDTSEPFLSTDGEIVAMSLSTVNNPDITNTPAAVSDTEKSLSPTASSSAISATTSSDTSSDDTSRATPITSIGTMPVDSTTVPMSNTVQATDTSGSILATDSNVVPSATSTITARNSTTTPSAVSFTLESISTTPPSGEISTTESSHISSPDTSRATPTTFIGTIDSTSVPESQSVLATDTSEPFLSTDGEIVATSLSTVNNPDITNTPAAVSDTEKSLSPTVSSSAISATTSSDTSSADISRVTPITSIGTMPVDSTTVPMSNTVQATDTSGSILATDSNVVPSATSTITVPDSTTTPSAVSFTLESVSTTPPSGEISTTESSHISSPDTSRATPTTFIGTIDSISVPVSQSVLATDTSEPFLSADGEIVAMSLSTVNNPDITNTPAAVSDTEKSLSPTASSSAISATTTSDTSSDDTSRVTPITSIGTMPVDSTTVPMSNTVQATDTSGSILATDSNVVSSATSTITVRDSTTTPSAVSFTLESVSTTPPSGEISTTESSHISSPDTSRAMPTTFIGTIDSTSVPESQSVLATDTSEPFLSTDGEIVATSLSTVNNPDITNTPAAVSDTEKSLSPTVSSSAISATTSSDTSSDDTSRVTPITSIGTMPVDSTTVPMSNTVQATDTSGSILATDSNVVPSATSTITVRDSTTTPSAVSFTLESVSTTPPFRVISTTESSHISSPDTSRATPTTFIGTIDSTSVPESQPVLATDMSEPFLSTDGEIVAMSLSTVNNPDITNTPAAVSDTEKSLSPTASSSAISATTSSDTSSDDTSRVTPITSIGTMPVDSTTVPMSNTVQATDTSGSILATDSNVVPSATSTITVRDSTTTPSAVSFTLESVSTTPPFRVISTTESSHISSPDTSRANPTTFIGTIDSTTVPESQSVLATDTSEPFPSTDGEIVVTSLSTVNIPDITKTPAAVSDTEKSLSPTVSSSAISATTSSDTSSADTSRVTPITSIGTMPVDSTTVPMSNTVQATDTSGSILATDSNIVPSATSTITARDSTTTPSAVSFTLESVSTTPPSGEISTTESSHISSPDTSRATPTTFIGTIDSTSVPESQSVLATDTSEPFLSTDGEIVAMSLSTVNNQDITNTPAAVSDTEKSLSPTASSSAISATTSSDTSSDDTSRVTPITSIGTMPLDSTTVPMSNTVQATDTSGSILATDSNVVPSATSTITARNSTTTPSAVSFTLESISTTPPSGEISTTESSHILSPDTSRATPTTLIGTIDSISVPESQSVLATDTSEPFLSTDGEIVATSLSTVNIPDITKTPAAVSDTEKSLSSTASSSAISATTSSDTSSADISRVTPITSIGTMPVDSTTVPMSNTVQATDTSGSILATDSNVVPSATSTITVPDSTTTPSAVSFTLESVSTTPPSGEISTTESSHISSPDTSRATPTTFVGTIDSTSVPESQSVLRTDTSEPFPSTDGEIVARSLSTFNIPDITKTPAAVSDTEKSLSSTASSLVISATTSSDTSSADTSRVTPFTSIGTMPVDSTTVPMSNTVQATDTSGSILATDSNVVPSATSTITVRDSTTTPSAVSFTLESVSTTLPSGEISTTESSHISSPDTSRATPTTFIGTIDSTSVPKSQSVLATDTSEPFLSTDGEIVATSLSTVNNPDITNTPASVSDTEKSLAPTASSSAISATTSSDTSSADTSRVTPITSIGTMPIDSTTVPMSNTVQATDTSGSILATDSNVVPSATSTITARDSTTTPSAVSFTLESVSTTLPSGEISTTESSHISSPDTSRATPTTFIGTIDSISVPVSQSVLATDMSEPFLSTDGEIVATSLSTVNNPDITNTPAAVSDTEKSLSPTVSSSAISATTSSDTSSDDTSRVTPITSIGTMPVDSTTVPMSNTVQATDTSGSILATDSNVVPSATSTITVRDSTTTPSAVSFTLESVSTTPPFRVISTTESSHISSPDTSRATPTTFIGTIDSTSVPESQPVLATDTSEPFLSTDGEIVAMSLSTVNNPDITNTPAAVSDTEKSLSPTASSSAISATTSSDTSSDDTSRVTPITSIGTMPVDSTTVPMSNTVQATDTSGSILATDSNVVPSATSTITVPDSTTTPSAVSFTLESVSTTPPSGEISTTESSHISSPDTSRATPTTFIGTIDSTSVPESQSVLATDTSEPFLSTDGEIVATSLSTVNNPDITNTPAAVSDTEKSLSPTVSSSAISATTSSDTSSDDTSRVTPITSIGTMPVDSTTVPMSNTVQATDTSGSILATDSNVVPSATSTITVRDSTTTPSAVSFTLESVSTTPPFRVISTTESSHISSPDTSRANPTTFIGTIDSTTVPESQSVLATDTSEPFPSTDGEIVVTSLSTVNIPDITKTPAAVSDTEKSLSPTVSSSAISATTSSDTSSADTSRVTPITSIGTMPVDSTTVPMSNTVQATDTSGSILATDSNIVPSATSTITARDSTTTPSAVSFTLESVSTTPPSGEISTTESSHISSPDTSRATPTTFIGTIDSTSVPESQSVLATDTSEPFLSTDGEIVAMSLSTVNNQDITNTPAAVSDTEKSLSPTASSSAISATTSSDTSSDDTSRVTPITSIGTMPLDSTTVPMSNTVQATDTSGSILATDSNVVPSATSTITARNSTTTPSAVSFTLESISTTPPSGEISTTESSHILSPDTSRATPTTLIGTIDSISVPESQSVLATDTSEPFLSTDGEIVATSLSTVNIPDITKTPAAVSDTEKSLSSTASSSAISATTSSDTSSADISRVTPITSIGTMPVDSTTVPMSNTVQATDTSGSILATDSNVVPSATSTITVPDSTTTPSAVSFTLESVSTTPPSGEISTTESSHISSPDTSRATPTTFVGTIDSTSVPESQSVLRTDTSEPFPSTDGEIVARSLSTFNIPDITKTPAAVSDTEKSLSSTASSLVISATTSSDTSSADTSRVTPFTSIGTMPVDSTTVPMSNTVQATDTSGSILATDSNVVPSATSTITVRDSTTTPSAVSFTLESVSTTLPSGEISTTESSHISSPDTSRATPTTFIGTIDSTSVPKSQSVLATDTSEPFLSTDGEIVATSLSTVNNPDITNTPAAVSDTEKSLAPTASSSAISATTSSDTSSADTSRVTPITSIGTMPIDSTTVPMSNTVQATDTSGSILATDSNVVPSATSTITARDSTTTPSAVSFTLESVSTTLPSGEISTTESSHISSPDTSRATPTTFIGTIDSTSVPVSQSVLATDMSEPFLSTDGEIVATSLSTVNIPDITNTPAAVSDTEKSLSSTASSSAISATTSSDTSSAYISRVTPITSIGTMPVDSTTVPMSNTVQATDTSGSILATDSNVVPSATSTITVRDSTTTPSAVSFTREAVSTTPPFGEISTTESSHISSPDTSRATPTTFVGTIDSTSVPESQSVLRTDTSEPFPSTNGEIVATSLSTVNIQDITKTPAAVSDTEKSLSPTVSSSAISATTSSDTSSADTSRVTPITSIGRMPVDSTTVPMSNTVQATDTSGSILATDSNVVPSATSTITVPDSTTTPSAVSFTRESVSTTPPSGEISTTESSHISSPDTSRAKPTTFIGTIDSTSVPKSQSVLATDTSEPFLSTDGEIVATSLSTVNNPDITNTPAAVSDTEKSLAPTASSSAISATTSSDTSSDDTSRVTPITSIGTMPIDSTTVPMSNTVQATDTSGFILATDSNVVPSATSTITARDSTTTPSAVSFTLESVSTTLPSGEISTTESSHISSPDTSRATPTTFIGTIDSISVPVSQSVLATDMSEPFLSTDGEIVATSLSTVNIPDITKMPAAVSDTEKSLSSTASSSAISATTSSDTSSADISRVTPITSIGTMPVASTTVPMSNTVQATDTSGSILATDSNVVPSATSTITVRDSTTMPSAVSFTREAVSTTPPFGEISTTESSHISSPDTSRATPTTFVGTIDSTSVPESQSVLRTDTSEPFPSTDGEIVATSLSTFNIPDITKTPAAVSDTEKSLSSTASSSVISATTSSDTSSADTSRVTPFTSIGTMPVDSTTVPMSNTVQATDTSGSIRATDSNIVPSATSTITVRDSTTIPSAVSFILESVSTTPPSVEISTSESSHLFSSDTSSVTLTTSRGMMPVDSTTFPISNTVLDTGTFGLFPNMDDNSVGTSLSMVTISYTTKTTSGVSDRQVSSPTIGASTEIIDTESSHTSSTLTSQGTLTTPLGIIAANSTTIPMSKTVRTTDTSVSFPTTDGNMVVTASSTITIPETTKSPSAVSDTEMPLLSMASSTEISATESADVSFADTARVTLSTPLGMITANSTTVLLSNAVRANYTSRPFSSTNGNMITTDTSTITIPGSTEAPSLVSATEITLSSMASSTERFATMSSDLFLSSSKASSKKKIATGSSDISSPDTSRVILTTPSGTNITQSTVAVMSNEVQTTDNFKSSSSTNGNVVATVPSTITVPVTTRTPSRGSTTQISLSSIASSTERIGTRSSNTSSTHTSTITLKMESTTTSTNTTTKMPTAFFTTSVKPPVNATILTFPDTLTRTTRSTAVIIGSMIYPISTSTSTPPSPGACPSLDFSLRLEKVTSDVIQFSWTPPDGRKESSYTASLSEDNREVNKSTTDKTNIEFKGLLPGQKYTISVEVSICGQKASTSMIVQTASKNFKGQTRLTNQVFTSQYSNKSSAAFKDFEKNFTAEIKDKLTDDFKTLFNKGRMLIVIDSIINGSVIVLFNIMMAVEQNLTETNISNAFIKALNESTLWKVDFQRTSVVVANSCETRLNDCSKYAVCTPKEATYSCECKAGFNDHSPSVPGKDCQDINECTNSSACSDLASCNNTVGSYECTCNPGIKDENPKNSGKQCKDPVLCFNSTTFCSTQNNDCLNSKNWICSSNQAFACKISFKDKVFVPEYYNSESQSYQNLSQKITTDVVKQMRISLKDDSFDIIVVGFRNGSVIAYFVSLLQGQQSIDKITLQEHLSKIVKNVFAGETEVIVEPIPTSSEVNLAWRNAVIVLGVLFGVAFILALLILSACLWMRCTSGQYWVEPKGLLGNFAYKYL